MELFTFLLVVMYLIVCVCGLLFGADIYDERISKVGWSVLDIILAILFFPTTIVLCILVVGINVFDAITRKEQYGKTMTWLSEPIGERKRRKNNDSDKL